MPPVYNRFLTDVAQRRGYLDADPNAYPDLGFDSGQGADTMPGGAFAAAAAQQAGGVVGTAWNAGQAAEPPPAAGAPFKPNTTDPAMSEWLRIAQQWGLDPNGPFMDDPRVATGKDMFGRPVYNKGNLSTSNLPGDQLEAARAAYNRYQQAAQTQRDAHDRAQAGAGAGVGDPAQRNQGGAGGTIDLHGNVGQTYKTDPPQTGAAGAGGAGAGGSGAGTPPPPDPNRALTAADLEKWRQEQASGTAQAKADAQAAQDAQWAKWQADDAARTAQREANSKQMYEDTTAKFGEAAALREQESRTQYNALLEKMQQAATRQESPEEVQARMGRDTNEGLLYKSLADATTSAQQQTADRQSRYDTQAEGDRSKLYGTLDNWNDAADPYAADAASTRADLLHYRDQAAPEAFQRALEARVSGALPQFQGQLQDIRETAIRRGVSGALPTSYEGDLASAFQRNIANAGAAQGVDLLGMQTGITSDLNTQAVNRGEALQGRAQARTGVKIGSITNMYNSALGALNTNANRQDQTNQNYQDTVAQQAARDQAQYNTQQSRGDSVAQQGVANAGSAYDRSTGAYQYGVNAGQQQQQDNRDWESYQLDRTDAASAAARARRDAQDNAWTGLAGSVAGYALGGPAGGALGSWLSGRRRSSTNGASDGSQGG